MGQAHWIDSLSICYDTNPDITEPYFLMQGNKCKKKKNLSFKKISFLSHLFSNLLRYFWYLRSSSKGQGAKQSTKSVLKEGNRFMCSTKQIETWLIIKFSITVATLIAGCISYSDDLLLPQASFTVTQKKKKQKQGDRNVVITPTCS